MIEKSKNLKAVELFGSSGLTIVNSKSHTIKRERESKKDAKKVTDGAGDEEAGMGVAEKRRWSVVVEAGDADHARVLLPRCHALLLILLLTIIDVGLCIFHCPLFFS